MPCAWQGAVRGGENVEGFPLAKLIWATLLQFAVALLVAVKLPRFRGHPTFWVEGVHDVEAKSTLPT
jgi:hypothetical protein